MQNLQAGQQQGHAPESGESAHPLNSSLPYEPMEAMPSKRSWQL
jgi:hypothetical protein